MSLVRFPYPEGDARVRKCDVEGCDRHSEDCAVVRDVAAGEDRCDQHVSQEDLMRSAPLHDGTCDCDDGIAPEARGAATRTSLLWRVVVVLAIVALVVAKVAS